MIKTGKDPAAGRTLLVGTAAAAALLVMATASEAATINVDTTTDEYGEGSGCSLREAVEAANSNAAFGGCPAGEDASTDVIMLPGGRHTLSLGGAGEDANAEGDLDVTESLKIVGTGANLRWKPDFKWTDWDQDEWFPFETGAVSKFLKSIGLGDLDRATRDLGDDRALYAQYVTEDATVIANGIGDPGTLGDGDRLFDINDNGVKLTLTNVALIDGDTGCTGLDCDPGAGAIERTGDGALKLTRVVIADNRSSCSGEGCGTMGEISPAGIAALGGGDLTIKRSLILSNRSECSDADCQTGYSALAFGELSSGYLEQGAGGAVFSNTAFVANETYCDTDSVRCNTANTINLKTEKSIDAANLWIVGNKNTCIGYDCDTDETFDAYVGETQAVLLTGVVFADNEQTCTGEDCDLDELFDLRGSGYESEPGTLDFGNSVFLRNTLTCNGKSCDTDEFADVSSSLGAVSHSALFFVRNVMQCSGENCDVDDSLFEMEGMSLTGEAIAFHRNKLVCDGSCSGFRLWELDSSDTTVESFVVSNNRFFIEDHAHGYELIDIYSEPPYNGPFLLKDGLIIDNTIECEMCLAEDPPNTIMRVRGDHPMTLRRVTFTGNQTDGVGGAIASGITSSGSPTAGDLKIFNSTISANSAGREGGGIFNSNGATLTITNSEITGNTAGTTGGGIFNDDGGIITLTGTTITGNTPDDCVGCAVP